ncbi:hypothetical protein AVEN_116875-1 [Araneus ventricosus]|uniref:Uncharacterized protein n=1 Tax=Araneus ventricosus TaxID=182803 RepID=A0A4Y2QIG0_ARAVE|nr:hypothetical protein AVEN_116875-1 [Araneus ventricosus]
MYHPSNGSPRTANTWGYIAVHEKQEANRAATAYHGELPRLPSREGMKGKTKLEEKTERDQTLGYLGVVNPVTSREDVPPMGGRRPDGTAHHGTQQGKAATGSGYSQPRRLPWC